MSTGLYCALDFNNKAEAKRIVDLISPVNPKFKIGLELFCAVGPDYVRELVAAGSDIFLDLKFHDIPNTAAGALRAVGTLGVSYTNIHISGGEMMVRSAVDAIKEVSGGRTKLLGVTVLTSLGKTDLEKQGISTTVETHVVKLAKAAQAWGLDGVVCSAEELRTIRQECGPEFETMVPGIRPVGAGIGDQTRVATPETAVQLGATNIVVGRPITKEDDPLAATKAILESLC